MEDMLPEIDKLNSHSAESSVDSGKDSAVAVAELLNEHKGQDVSVLDIRQICDWTDFFVIATASSKTHMDGLERHTKNFCREREIDILRTSRKDAEDEWRLLDLGWAVIHLMTKQAREFYDLERLWSN